MCGSQRTAFRSSGRKTFVSEHAVVIAFLDGQHSLGSGVHYVNRTLHNENDYITLPPRCEDRDAAKVQRVLQQYENQTDEEAVAEDEAAYDDEQQTIMIVPTKLVPEMRRLFARRGVS